MLLHDFTYVDLPWELARSRMDTEAPAGLSALAVLAGAEGDALRRRIDASVPAPSLTGATVVTAGEPSDLAGITLVPLVWRAAAGTPPLAVADLELAPLGPGRTQLTLLGRSSDARGDGPVQYRVLQATMRSFLHHLAGRLQVASEAMLPLAG